jgi:hypothetical protein
MTLEELKKTISDRTGLPVPLLTGETPDEVITQGKALLAFRDQQQYKAPKTEAEQFAEWFEDTTGTPQRGTWGAIMAEIEEAARVDAGGYPRIQDGGGAGVNVGDGRTKEEQFAEWLGRNASFDPSRQGEWKKLL